jgi:hypothetical protein
MNKVIKIKIKIKNQRSIDAVVKDSSINFSKTEQDN